MIKYSIIIPFYSVEKYIVHCVDSIISQDYDNFEIVLVDDGSPDKSFDLCFEKYGKCQNVKIIRQNNMGLGEARNTGIRHSNGEYLIFVDSDDYWLLCNSLSLIDSKIEETKADVLVFGASFIDEISNQTLNKSNKKIKTTKDMIINDFYLASAWNKVVKRTFFVEHQLFFNKGFSEDLDWSARILLLSPRIAVLQKNIYAYRLNRAGSISNINAGKVGIIADVYERCLFYRDTIESNKGSVNLFKLYVSEIYRLVLVNYLKAGCYDDRISSFLIKHKKASLYLYKNKILKTFYFVPHLFYLLFIRKRKEYHD